MKEKNFYNVYSEYLKEKYKEKVYKLPLNLPGTCPNRDGCVGTGGCIFCGEEGGSFENLSNNLSIGEQINSNMDYIKKRYKAKKFIAYFQNFTNTYHPIDKFKEYIEESVVEDVVEISISTRPDCISDAYLECLKEISEKYRVNISIELGLQTVNYHTLEKINRGHTLAEFIDSSLRIKKFGFEICTHLILNLPWDDTIDVIESAKIISSLGINQIKLHSLYIVEGTKISDLYKRNEFEMISKEEYIERVITFLEYLEKNIVIQRLIGRAPEENTLFVNWNTSWWKIKDEILEKMEKENRYQGKKFNYLNGKALKKFK
ncbi:radical SAM domain-containing CHP01212 [Gottschalkia acidurici 9a]|uniref:Radical SAM domain-containing CHP01212 n=1 Tax=Gottschalkia acidurici (strain ATCC 7906 / DSM 604 / BCRC 14475 / CIP 104303 / KCTC 5404 / NCIMB 10678 / 9a) TaxID=1128398 RepID=K0AZ58_GOTA9|nr:TIGR01212 family radical SAM protein [Gottschalkia acidurici]AFS78077.1 radical SAM domain-containing CHP01212 [Gottschalkia acidurici 9a]